MNGHKIVFQDTHIHLYIHSRAFGLGCNGQGNGCSMGCG